MWSEWIRKDWLGGRVRSSAAEPKAPAIAVGQDDTDFSCCVHVKAEQWVSTTVGNSVPPPQARMSCLARSSDEGERRCEQPPAPPFRASMPPQELGDPLWGFEAPECIEALERAAAELQMGAARDRLRRIGERGHRRALERSFALIQHGINTIKVHFTGPGNGAEGCMVSRGCSASPRRP